jgi:hypothetical protein
MMIGLIDPARGVLLECATAIRLQSYSVPISFDWNAFGAVAALEPVILSRIDVVHAATAAMLAGTIAVLDHRANKKLSSYKSGQNELVRLIKTTQYNACDEEHLQRVTIILKCLYFLAPLSTDGRHHQGDRHDFTRGQIEREVVRVAFVHDLHTKIGTVNDVGRSVDDPALRVHND